MSKEMQIEEMAKDICEICMQKTDCKANSICTMAYIEAENLTDKGYRKQSEGEWIDVEDTFLYRYKCSLCGEIKLGKMTNFCPNCGAKMKGGAE